MCLTPLWSTISYQKHLKPLRGRLTSRVTNSHARLQIDVTYSVIDSCTCDMNVTCGDNLPGQQQQPVSQPVFNGRGEEVAGDANVNQNRIGRVNAYSQQSLSPQRQGFSQVLRQCFDETIQGGNDASSSVSSRLSTLANTLQTNDSEEQNDEQQYEQQFQQQFEDYDEEEYGQYSDQN